MKLKFGLDIGVASVGWGIIDENYHVIDCGVRLFSENSAKENETRRTMRSSRRRLRRLQHRLQRMEKVLINVLGVEKPSEVGNIYEIRCRGLQQRLTKEELFAAIMHLAKRRGTHFLTAEDFNKVGEEKTTEEILQEQAEKLKDKYVCQIQYQKFLDHGKVRGIENRFRNQEYRKELLALLTKQGEFYPVIKNAADKITAIYDSKRHYSIGPGGPKNPTPYGCYRQDQEGNIIEVNLIDLMRGKCTYYPEEKRMAHNAYTACLFNLMNDLNNMTAAGNPISYEQKQQLVEKYINEGKSITLKIIAKVTGVKEEELRGYRIDTKEKAIFTEFAGYKATLKALEKAGIDNAFIKGNRKLVDAIADILTLEKEVDKRYDKLINEGISIEVAQELKKLSSFTKYHSLSQKAMELILGDLWQTNYNQMKLFTDAGLLNQQKEELRGINIPFDGSNWIVSPITKRSVNEAIKVINQARVMVRKKYNCEFAEIVIEMAREKNTDERVKFIKDLQKKNEKIRQQVGDLVNLKKLNGKQFELMKLLIEQDFRCAYSGKQVGVGHVLNGAMEIDHIIPKSLSFDDSLANKVAVLSMENQKKGQTTPYQYLKSGHGQQSYEEFKAWVLNNPNYKKNKKKRENLLYEGNPQQDLEGFINRNLVDTRYACRAVLNLLQSYFKENKLGTKVSVVKGSFTHAFRKRAHLYKDRDATYAHHAQDALIVAGLSNTDLIKKVNKMLSEEGNLLGDKETLRLVNGKLVNTTTGELIEEKDFDCTQYIRFIKTIDTVKPKYSHKVDRKPNRALYNQQIKSTRDKDGKTYIITKYKNIYEQGLGNSGEKLKQKIKTKPEDLLMYHHDPKTFALLQEIVDFYPDSKNPFADYYAEHGPIRKFSKKGNGPIISDVKFYDGALGSHRPNLKQQGNNMSVYLSIKTMRADFYLDDGVYKFISVPYDMVAKRGDQYYIDVEKYNLAKQNQNKKISDQAEFLFSLHTGEMFSYEKDGEKVDWVYNCVNNDVKNVIETKFIDQPSPGKTQPKRMITIGKKISNLVKYHVDVLGNRHKVNQEVFSTTIIV
jgi:CRISPR-associated endonuclease Csn1